MQISSKLCILMLMLLSISITSHKLQSKIQIFISLSVEATIKTKSFIHTRYFSSELYNFYFLFYLSSVIYSHSKFIDK